MLPNQELCVELRDFKLKQETYKEINQKHSYHQIMAALLSAKLRMEVVSAQSESHYPVAHLYI